jgi:hypothetical protein
MLQALLDRQGSFVFAVKLLMIALEPQNRLQTFLTTALSHPVHPAAGT